MNRFLIVIVLFIVMNILFSIFPYLFPTVSPANFMPYQLWINAIIIFILILPSAVGSYVYDK